MTPGRHLPWWACVLFFKIAQPRAGQVGFGLVLGSCPVSLGSWELFPGWEHVRCVALGLSAGPGSGWAGPGRRVHPPHLTRLPPAELRRPQDEKQLEEMLLEASQEATQETL